MYFKASMAWANLATVEEPMLSMLPKAKQLWLSSLHFFLRVPAQDLVLGQWFSASLGLGAWPATRFHGNSATRFDWCEFCPILSICSNSVHSNFGHPRDSRPWCEPLDLHLRNSPSGCKALQQLQQSTFSSQWKLSQTCTEVHRSTEYLLSVIRMHLDAFGMVACSRLCTHMYVLGSTDTSTLLRVCARLSVVRQTFNMSYATTKQPRQGTSRFP